MRCLVAIWSRWAAIALGLAVMCSAQYVFGAGRQGKEGTLPPWKGVQKGVRQFFAGLKDYEPGDIITRSQVEPLFGQLRRMGWTVADEKEILDRLPADNDFLVQQLRTPVGREVMRQFDSFADTYDRLERISRLPRGELTVSELLKRPGKGADVIRYLAQEPKGIKASQEMARKGVGADFDQPTGRVYTQDMLLERLQRSYEAAQRRQTAEKQQPATPATKGPAGSVPTSAGSY